MSNTWSSPGPDYWLFFYCQQKKEVLRERNRKKNLSGAGLTVQKVYELYKQKLCNYCGKECIVDIVDQTHNKLKHNHATIDRVDPLIGYQNSNIVLACHSCNQKKSKKEQKIVEKFGRKPRGNPVTA